jgi:hypothetical protein
VGDWPFRVRFRASGGGPSEPLQARRKQLAQVQVLLNRPAAVAAVGAAATVSKRSPSFSNGLRGEHSRAACPRNGVRACFGADG